MAIVVEAAPEFVARYVVGAPEGLRPGNRTGRRRVPALMGERRQVKERA